MTTSPDYVIVVDPESLRWQHYHRDLHEFIQQFEPRPTVHLLNWADVVEADGDISHWLPNRSALLRVESPARDFELARLLMQAGEKSEGEPISQWNADREGWIASPRMHYHGLCRILSNVEECVRDSPCQPTSNLQHTQDLFDKNGVSRRLREHSVNTPESFEPFSVEQLVSEQWSRNWDECYVKLAYGSCASGIAILGQQSLTTVVEIDGRFYNTYNVQKLPMDRLEPILRFLLSQVATAQAAVPKLKLGKDDFDIRMVMIGGGLAASVFRASPIPITNLHLGGYRADEAACRRLISNRAWADAVDLCWQASQMYDMAALGIDLAFDRHSMEPTILEINSFGDFFPNWRDEDGRTLHQLEIESTSRRWRDA